MTLRTPSAPGPSARAHLLQLAAVLLLASASFHVAAGTREDDRARNAVRVINEMQVIPESAIPDKLLDEAHAIAVIPDTVKAGLIFGGQRGHGLLSVKTPEGTWSNPVFITLTGGSIGFQVGVQSADIVLVFSSPRGLEEIVNGKITLGADAAVAAGPVGRHASIATDGAMKAEIWSWSRARGLFAGVALDGAVLAINDDANVDVYGAGTTPRMILEGAPAAPVEAVTAFVDTLEEGSAAAAYARGTGLQAEAATGDGATGDRGRGERAGAVTAPAGATPVAQPGAFEPVPADEDDNPAEIEPLPQDG